MYGKEKVVFNMTNLNEIAYTLDDFERDAKVAAMSGATHILLSQVEKSRWIWERDRTDPYPNWGMILPSLFKLIVPEELKNYLPEDYANRNLDIIKERSRIATKYGLKGALHFCEPFYFPEEAYRDHPEWRGPRCDHPRRSRNAYYSPCTDNPEILSMYRKTTAKLLDVIDVDYIYIHTNDCGGGLCWAEGLYVGKNGPEACKHRSHADRVMGFLDTFIDGARDVGKEIDVEINANMGIKASEPQMENMWPKLKDRTAVNHKSNKGTPLSSYMETWYEYTYSPIRSIPLPIYFLERLEASSKEGSPILYYFIPESDGDLYPRIFKKFADKPTDGLADRMALLQSVAEDIAGEGENARDLMEAWNKLHIAYYHFLDTNIEGLSWCSINQRWINRPFVLFPQELTAEEKDYYRPFQFQANDEAQADDLLNMQCTSFIRGYYAIFLANKMLNRAIAANAAAQKSLEAIAKRGGTPGVVDFALVADRVALLNCFLQNAIHAMRFQDIIDNTDYDQPAEISPRWPIDAEPRSVEYDQITRAEIDNTIKVIKLIEGREIKMLLMAHKHELEDAFLLSPKIVEQLHKKMNIMLNHQLDGKRLFVTHNK